ncbi:MAG TPA: hypothetical protein VF462_14665 [Micromonosporaceae bacterium]
MTRRSRPFSGSDLPIVFPDWSPYQDLAAAARAYLRDPDLALDTLAGVLAGTSVLGFTLERFVNETNGVWQEAAVCDGQRLILWHGEDVPEDEGPVGCMTSSLRVVPLSTITEVGCRRRLSRGPDGAIRVHSADVYLLLASLDEATPVESPYGLTRHDALRFGKTLEDGGAGQISRLEDFARLVASRIGRPLSDS